MGFARQGLWVTGYCGLMGYGLQIPAHQLGGPKMAWDFRGYGLSEAWVKRVLTVVHSVPTSIMYISLSSQTHCLGDRRFAAVPLGLSLPALSQELAICANAGSPAA